MTDLRKAAEMALEAIEDAAFGRFLKLTDAKKALRQALAQPEQEPVTLLPDGSAFGVMSFPLPKSHWLYAEREYRDGEYEPIELGKPILTHELRGVVVSAMRYAIRGATNLGKEMDFDPDALVQNAVYALCGPYTPHVDAVNMSQERVDETAKGEHGPWPSVQCVCGGTIYFKYTPPISDYHEGWEEGFKAAKREWVGLTDDEIGVWPVWSLEIEAFVRHIEAKLKEKNDEQT